MSIFSLLLCVKVVLSWFALIEGFSSALLAVNNGSQAARPSLAREEDGVSISYSLVISVLEIYSKRRPFEKKE